MKSIHLNYFEMPVTKIYEREKTFKKSALKESRFRFFFRLLDSSVKEKKKKKLISLHQMNQTSNLLRFFRKKTNFDENLQNF